MVDKRILIIEDDSDIIELLRYNLERERFSVSVAQTGELGLELAESIRPALILLDLGLPGIQGLEVCKILKSRKRTAWIPIVMLTARGEESDVVIGLEMGADDYVAKPFKVRELVARVRAVLRRSSTDRKESDDDYVEMGPLRIDSERHEVSLEGQLVEFTLTEFRLLKRLASNPGRVLTRQQLLNEITEGTAYIVDRNVDVHIRSIRKKLGSARDLINTVRGVGYKFQDRVAR
jgi:DNA-binding response OmpR family regulator